MTKFIDPSDITPAVSYSEWYVEYPKVDREYVWIYPLLNGSGFEPKRIFERSSIPLVSNETAIYIHVPACLFRCPMCPFYLEIVKDRDQLIGYADAIIKELQMYKNSEPFNELDLQAVYFGGGTASLLYPRDIGKIITQIKQIFPSSKPEITVENHPAVVDYDYLSAIYDEGVNRVSFGIQSFDDKQLKTLGLRQTKKLNVTALKNATSIGFNTVAADLLYRTPNQTIETWESAIKQALDLGVTGISAYSLELSVRQGKLREMQPNENVDKEMFYFVGHYLQQHGWNHLAQPDYAAPGHENVEIEVSWRAPQGQSLSFGAGAWSTFNNNVYVNVHDYQEYISTINSGHLPILSGKTFSIEDAMSRYLVLGTRCFEIPFDKFRQSFDQELEDVFRFEIDRLTDQDLIEKTNDAIVITSKGKYYVDNISKQFYSLANRCRMQPWGANMIGAISDAYYHLNVDSGIIEEIKSP